MTIETLTSSSGQAADLAAIPRRSSTVVAALRAAREVDAPHWLVGAGAISNAVWTAGTAALPPIPRTSISSSTTPMTSPPPATATATATATVREETWRLIAGFAGF